MKHGDWEAFWKMAGAEIGPIEAFGDAKLNEFVLELSVNDVPKFTGSFKPEDVVGTIERTVELQDKELYERIVYGEGVMPGESDGPYGQVEVNRYVHTPGKRCLWGWRRGWIQVGSKQDEPTRWTMFIGKVKLVRPK